MLKDVVAVEPLDGLRLKVRFEDGLEGSIDLAEFGPLEGVFAPLRDPAEFRSVRVNRELGTVTWPSGADLDPDMLYAKIAGQPLGRVA
jgi:hypothetical protein